MNYFTLKVILKLDEIVFRDLLVSEKSTLKELHQSIIEAFQFKGEQLASFLITDGGIQANDEFPLEKLGENDSRLMEDVTVGDVLSELGDQLTYIYDYVNEWRFEIEVIESSQNESHNPPELINSYGKAPKESDRDLSGSDAENILMNAILGDEFDDLEDDDDLFDSGEFDSLDDYEEYQ